MNIASLQKVHLHWREDGNPDGRPIVFANSLGTDFRLWDKLLPLLPQHFRFIRFDKRGHGLSSTPEGPYQITDLVTDTEQFLDLLQIKDSLFVGISIGGMIGQVLASRRPDLISAMVLSNTTAKMGDSTIWQQRIAAIESGGMSSMADMILSRWFSSEFLDSSEAVGWRNLLEHTSAGGYTGCCHAIAEADLRQSTAALRLPVMGIAGSEDAASPPESVRATINLIPDAQCHVITGAGHLPCVDKPADYAALLGSFIDKTSYGQ